MNLEHPVPVGKDTSCYFKLEYKMGLCFAAMAILISGLLTFGLYRISVGWLHSELRHRISDAVSIAALQLDATEFNQLTNPSQQSGVTYQKLLRELRKIRAAGRDYRFVYTVRKTTDGKIRFIVDAEEDPSLILQIGEVYDAPGPTLTAQIDTLDHTVVEETFYTDKWGTWLTGYAPLPGAEGADKVVLGMDVAATTVKQKERDFLWAAMAAFGVSLPFSLGFGVFLGRRLTGPVKALTRGAERITSGDLDYSVKPHGNDEIGELAVAFNTMTGKLSHTLESLKKSENELISHRDHLEELVNKRTAKLADANERMHKNLLSAAQVQKAFLPQEPPQIPGIRFAWNFTPCDELAGDMLGITEIDTQHIGIWVADVCGHGVAAALVSVTLNRVLSALIASNEINAPEAINPDNGKPVAPADIATLLNERFEWNPETMRYFTILYAILDIETHEFRYVSAGHPGPLLVSRKGEVRILPMSPPAIGILSKPEFTEHRIQLEAGDRIYLYTDGITEASNESDVEFGETRLASTFKLHRNMPLQSSIDSLLAELAVWRNAQPPVDDLSIIALELS